MKFTSLHKQIKKGKSIVELGLLDLKTAAYYPHYDFLYQEIEDGNLRTLDFGSGEGIFSWLLTQKIKDVYAYDVDKRKIERARKRFPDVKFLYGNSPKRLPFRDSFFDAVVAGHVLEHVQNEKQTIAEIHRILKPNGVLYVVSPHQGILAFLDSGNLRYRFPKLHRWLYLLIFGEKEYKNAFQNSKKYGLYGDCSIGRKWHQHYKKGEIEKLLNDKFRILEWRKFSLFCPILLVAKGIWELISSRPNNLLDRLILADHNLQVGDLSYTFFVKAKKN